MFAFSSQDKTIAEFIKITPFISMWTIDSQYCVWLPDDPRLFLCFVMVVHESLVCPEQLNWALFFRKFLQLLQIHQFSSIFCIFEPFPAVTMIFRSILSHWGQLRDSNSTIKKGSNIHWCSRRKHDALRAEGWKLLNRMEMSQFFLFYLNIIVFHLILPFGSRRRYLHVSRQKN